MRRRSKNMGLQLRATTRNNNHLKPLDFSTSSVVNSKEPTISRSKQSFVRQMKQDLNASEATPSTGFGLDGTDHSGLRHASRRLFSRLGLKGRNVGEDIDFKSTNSSVLSEVQCDNESASGDQPLEQVISARSLDAHPAGSSIASQEQQLNSSDLNQPLEILLGRPKIHQSRALKSPHSSAKSERLSGGLNTFDAQQFRSFHPIQSLDSTPSNSSTYEYLPLRSSKAIRILEILPGRSDDDIVCRIFHTSFGGDHTTPRYTALSYVWGSPIPRKVIICNGRRFLITQNLESALRALRMSDIARVMWIDQICINQKDNEERCAQVQIMKDIFGEAENTVAWLGTSSESATIAIQFANRLSNTVDDVMENHARGASGMLDNQTHSLIIADVLRALGDDNPGWEALGKLLESAWFSRIWIIQEMFLSKILIFQWGEKQITWKVISKLFRKLWSYLDVLNRIIKDDELRNVEMLISLKERLVANSWPAPHLSSFISLSYWHESTDPRDKVYALLSLAKTSHSQGLTPDYNMPTRIVFEKATRAVLKEDGGRSLRFLNRGGEKPPDQRLTGLPSWSRDFTRTDGAIMSPAEFDFDASSSYSLSKNTSPFWQETNHQSLFIVQGRIIDTITDKLVRGMLDYIEPADSRYWPNLLLIADHLGVCTQLAQEAASKENSRTRMEQNWRAMIRGVVSDFPNKEDVVSPQYRENFEQLVEIARRCVTMEEFKEYMVNWPTKKFYQAERWSRLFAKATETGQFTTTQSGRLGWVPFWAERGDRIAVVQGSAVPWVIRPAGNHRWQRLGTCYIEGIMYGETMKDSEYHTDDLTFC